MVCHQVLCITLSKDDNRLASAQLGGVVRLWDVTNVSCVTVIKSQHQLITGLRLYYFVNIFHFVFFILACLMMVVH